jgi:N-acetylglucosamine-6-phosphate deacetylase
LPDGQIAAVSLALEGGRILSLGADVRTRESLDVGRLLIVPGFIDLHTHGSGRESALDDLRRFAEVEARWGVTTFYPTLFCPPAIAMETMRRHLAETDCLRQLPQVGGFRLESPYLAHTGGGLSQDLAPISRDLTGRLLEAGGGYIAIWDISPELPGAAETIKYLADRGVRCSLAHTRATIDQARAAVRAGARLVTHLFDVFPPPTVRGPETGVYPAGLVDYLLIEDRLASEIIPDGTHVHPLLVEKAFRCKPREGLVFVSDSNFGAGLPPGEYELPNGRGRARINGPNDGLRLAGRAMILAGSALTPDQGFRNAVELFGKDLATASRVWSRNPAFLMGLNKGEIREGRDADLVILDDQFQVIYTIVAGRVVYGPR